VLPAPRLFDDLTMLETIFRESIPTDFPIRFRLVAKIVYGFADASGRGLGSMMQSQDEAEIRIRIGVWSTSQSEERSSNWREFTNVVEAIIQEAMRGRLHLAIVFVFTDNSTVESAFTKGNTPIKVLFELIEKIKGAMMKFCF